MQSRRMHFHNLSIDIDSRTMCLHRGEQIKNHHRNKSASPSSLTIRFGCAADDNGNASIQGFEIANDSKLKMIYTDGLLTARISYDDSNQLYDKYTVIWTAADSYHYLKDTILLDSQQCCWYGGALIAQQKWPINRNSHPFGPYLPADTLKVRNESSGLERYWLNSEQFVIFVPIEVPLWTEFVDGRFSLQAQYRDSPYSCFQDSNELSLCYTIYSGKCSSLKEFHLAVHKSLYPSCTKMPSTELMKKSIWTTWAKFKEKINQTDLIDYAKNLIDHGVQISQIELDDNWSKRYGDFEFDCDKFPNVSAMCDQLNEYDIHLSLWVHPFVNLDSISGENEHLHKLFLKYPSGEPAVITWWHGDAFVLDFTNAETVVWFRDRLNALKQLGIHSFKFDAGEFNYLPEQFVLSNSTNNSPLDYVTAYVDVAASFGDCVEVRVGNGSQHHGILLRTMDRLTTWDDAGLSSLIPFALNLSIHGYFYNLPDIIGGNCYDGTECNSELFVRWMQANLFLVVMQFSILPWQLGEDVEKSFKKLMVKRNEISEILIDACLKSCVHGEPIIRPMWWLSECDDSFNCGDQFEINDEIVVAPILGAGATKRSVFIPDGLWECARTGVQYQGPIMIEATADLGDDSPPYFVRV